MKNIIIMVGLIIISSSQIWAQTPEDSEKKKIENVIEQYKLALNTSDALLAQSLFTEDGVLMPYNGPTATGSEELLNSYKYVFSQFSLKLEFEIGEIIVHNKLAYASTKSSGTLVLSESGNTVPEKNNRELFVFEKVDGNWKIAMYMFNKSEAPKQH